jgi:hypothetical protein
MEELVWSDTAVEPNTMDAKVTALRRILGKQSVRAISGTGWRFALPIECLDQPPSSRHGEATTIMVPIKDDLHAAVAAQPVTTIDVQLVKSDKCEDSERYPTEDSKRNGHDPVQFYGCFLGASVGGVLAGIATAVAYYLHYPASGLYRSPLIFAYGCLIGSGCGATVEFALPIFERWVAPGVQWILAVILCALTGAPVGAIGAGLFVPLGGHVEPTLFVNAWLLGTACIAPVAIARRGARFRTLLTAVLCSICASAFHCFLAGAILLQYRIPIASTFVGKMAHPIMAGALVGISVGALMGSQLWSALWLFARLQRGIATNNYNRSPSATSRVE